MRAKADAFRLYLLLCGVQSFAMSMVFTVNLVYQVTQVGLNPLQLVLIGTCLEITAFTMEIPTGIVADIYSRRLSVIIGIALLGVGFIVEGSFPRFETLLLAQVIIGLGFTFTSGAESAWIVDEIGNERAAVAFLRGAQVSQLTGFLAILVSVAVASVSLQLAIVSAGVILICFAFLLPFVMPEAGFKRAKPAERETWTALLTTFRAGFTLVRSRRILLLIMLATIIHGAFSEGFDRLWTAHLLNTFALPPLGALDEIVWFGIISAVAMPFSLLSLEWIRRRVDLTQDRALTRALTMSYAALIGSVLLFCLGEGFALALCGLWLAGALRQIQEPLMEAFTNQHTESVVRATVLSIQSQADAFGQIAGGPAVGVIGLLFSVRLAISLSALMLLPILPLFRRAGQLKP